MPSCKGAKLMEGNVFKGSIGHQELAAWVEGLDFKGQTNRNFDTYNSLTPNWYYKVLR